jgi:uracil phosphoribosyltransferase
MRFYREARVGAPTHPRPFIVTAQILDHPVALSLLRELRHRDTSPARFREVVAGLSTFLGLAATADLRGRDVSVPTPLEETAGLDLDEEVALVPILRAGLGMVRPLALLLPEASVRHLGFFRDEQALQPVPYYNKLPSENPPGRALVLDPMLATGGTAVAACAALRDWGVERVQMLSLIGAPEGVAALAAADPAVDIHLAALDRGLDEKGYIRPGLGDAGDRQFATA